MKSLSVQRVANFFDELDEKYLVPFDVNPNPKLPHAQQRVYRIKDFFIVAYRNSICKFREDEEDMCRIKFFEIFFDNLIHVMQVDNEEAKLKMMADYEHYESTMNSDRNLNSNTHTTDGSNNTTTNKTTGLGRSGSLQGTVDAIAMGSVNKSDLITIDTQQLPHVIDKNIRHYTQSVNISDDVTNVTVEDVGTGSTSTRAEGTQNVKTRQGIEALNQFRAHSVQVRRMREEMVQCFNVLFW